MIDIDLLMPKFCAAGARALTRYAEISGEDPLTAPEYFMTSLAFNELGNSVIGNGRQLGLTLETTYSTLWKWNIDVRSRPGSSLDPLRDPMEFMRLGEQLGSQRVDMVLFHGTEDLPKSQYDFLALAEFKRGDLRIDRERVSKILTYIDTCPYGVICGWVESKYVEYHRGEAIKFGDRWHQEPVPASTSDNISCFFCARFFNRPASTL
ncbi:MAG: hypothetical protein WA459_04200 [Stellaceae bacterium]